MAPGPTLQELIDTVRSDARGQDELIQLLQASKIVADLEQTSDALLGHFVDQCRRSGRSWSEISGALGVSKQAAHKRFSPDATNLERFTDRARHVLAQSEEEAQRLGHGFVGTEHLLLSLFDSPDSVAAQVLGESGITKSMVDAQIVVLIKPGKDSEEGKRPFTPRAKAVIGNAIHEALQLGHNYVGTEHILIALFSDRDAVAAKVLGELGATHNDTRARILRILGRVAQ